MYVKTCCDKRIINPQKLHALTYFNFHSKFYVENEVLLHDTITEKYFDLKYKCYFEVNITFNIEALGFLTL